MDVVYYVEKSILLRVHLLTFDFLGQILIKMDFDPSQI